MLVGAFGLRQFAGLPVDVEVTLARAIDAVGPMQAGVEPLGTVWGTHLHGKHVAMLVEECARILLGGEVTALPAPIGPGAGQPIEHRPGVDFTAHALRVIQLRQRALIGHGPPEPRRDLRLLDALQSLRDAGFAKILLCENICSDLAPVIRNHQPFETKDHGAVRILDLGCGAAECDRRVGRFAGLSEAPIDFHCSPRIEIERGRCTERRKTKRDQRQHDPSLLICVVVTYSGESSRRLQPCPPPAQRSSARLPHDSQFAGDSELLRRSERRFPSGITRLICHQ